MRSAERGRLLCGALVLAYLLSAGLALHHPLEAAAACSGCEAGGPAVAADCSEPFCPEREHHHHRSQAHDAALCGLCQKHFSAVSHHPLRPEGREAAPPAAPAEPACAVQASCASAPPPARAPPLP